MLATTSTLSYAQSSSTDTARLQTTVNQISHLYELCIDRGITSDQYQSESTKLLNGIYRDSLINKDAYDAMIVSINKATNNCKLYQTQMEQLDAASIAYDEQKISADTLRIQVEASLSVLLDNELITQEDFDRALSRLEDTLRPADRRQAQPQPQTTQATTDDEKAALELYNLLDRCMNGAITPEQFQNESQKIIDAVNTNGNTQQRDNLNQMIQMLTDECRAKQPTSPQNSGSASATNTNTASNQNSGSSSASNTNTASTPNDTNTTSASTPTNPKYSWFKEEMNKLDIRLDSGRMPMRRWKASADELVDEMQRGNYFTAEEAANAKEYNKKREHDYYNDIIGHDYGGSYTCYNSAGYASTCYDPGGDYTASGTHHRPSEFRLRFGLQAGPILDTLYENSDRTDTTMVYTGLNIDMAYVWTFDAKVMFHGVINSAGIGLYFRQDLGLAMQTGDMAEITKPFFIGTTIFGMRTELAFYDATVVIPLDIGVGMAYASKPKLKSDLELMPFLFNNDLENSVVFALQFGTGFDYYVSDFVALGIGIYFNYIVCRSFKQSFEYVNWYTPADYTSTSINRDVWFIQPDLHITIAFE